MRLEEIKDKPVIGIAEGQKLGEVQDGLLATSYVQVAALVIGGGGLFGGPKRAVEYESVRGIGPDAVMVSGPDAVAEIVDPSPLAALHPVTDLSITDKLAVVRHEVLDQRDAPHPAPTSGVVREA